MMHYASQPRIHSCAEYWGACITWGDRKLKLMNQLEQWPATWANWRGDPGFPAWRNGMLILGTWGTDYMYPWEQVRSTSTEANHPEWVLFIGYLYLNRVHQRALAACARTRVRRTSTDDRPTEDGLRGGEEQCTTVERREPVVHYMRTGPYLYHSL